MSHTTTTLASFVRRFRAVIAIAAALALLWPGVASADQFDNDLAQLRDVAAQWWASYGLTYTHCGEVVISHGPLSEGEWGETNEAADDPGHWFPVCRITISDNIRINTPTTWYAGRYVSARALLCAVVLHEWGHLLLGPEHSTDPTNIMFGGPIGTPPVCVQWAAPPKGQGQPLPCSASISNRHARYVMAHLMRLTRPSSRRGSGSARGSSTPWQRPGRSCWRTGSRRPS
jgi:hypothetical protein